MQNTKTQFTQKCGVAWVVFIGNFFTAYGKKHNLNEIKVSDPVVKPNTLYYEVKGVPKSHTKGAIKELEETFKESIVSENNGIINISITHEASERYWQSTLGNRYSNYIIQNSEVLSILFWTTCLLICFLYILSTSDLI